MNLPADFNINFGGDVFRTEALERAPRNPGLPDQRARRNLFRPVALDGDASRVVPRRHLPGRAGCRGILN